MYVQLFFRNFSHTFLMEFASPNASIAKIQRSGSTGTIKSPSQIPQLLPYLSKRLNPLESKHMSKQSKQITVKCSKQLPNNLCQLRSTPAAKAQAQPMTRRTASKQKQKPSNNNNKCKAALQPTKLELIVVGHRLNMHPLHMPMLIPALMAPSAVSGRVAKSVRLSEQHSLAKCGNGQLKQPSQGKVQVVRPADNFHIVEEGEYVYIYESCPLEQWPTELNVPNEWKLASEMELDLKPLGQVVDERFLAELLDELLINDEVFVA